MAEVLSVATRNACDVLWLGVWEHNPRAVAFYRKKGFRVVGDHVFQLGSDPQRDLIMTLEIGAEKPNEEFKQTAVSPLAKRYPSWPLATTAAG